MVEWIDKRRKDNTLLYSECIFGRFKLLIHHHMSLSYDRWWVSCTGLFDNMFLCEGVFSEAKLQAEQKLQTVLQEALDELLKDYN